MVLIFIDSLPMDGIGISRTYLEALSSEELIKWADHYGVDIPSDLDRVFIIEELLEMAASNMNVEEEYAEEPHVKFLESAVLPKQYNITFIETLVRDPLWAYIFWEIKGADRDIYENAADFSGYHLKVSPWGHISQDEVFIIPITPEDNARYLGFPPVNDNVDEEAARHRGYKVELFASLGGEETFLAGTDPFKLPALSPRFEKQECRAAAKYPLVRLSGIEDFHILRNGDREYRMEKRGKTSI